MMPQVHRDHLRPIVDGRTCTKLGDGMCEFVGVEVVAAQIVFTKSVFQKHEIIMCCCDLCEPGRRQWTGVTCPQDPGTVGTGDIEQEAVSGFKYSVGRG